jgi:hypothetical protein
VVVERKRGGVVVVGSTGAARAESCAYSAAVASERGARPRKREHVIRGRFTSSIKLLLTSQNHLRVFAMQGTVNEALLGV